MALETRVLPFVLRIGYAVNEQMFNLLEILLGIVGLIVIPWSVWVTVSVFSQRQALAVLKAELSAIERIEKAVAQLTIRHQSGMIEDL